MGLLYGFGGLEARYTQSLAAQFVLMSSFMLLEKLHFARSDILDALSNVLGDGGYPNPLYACRREYIHLATY